MNQEIQLKSAIGAIIAVFGYLFNCFTALIVVLAIFMAMDWVLNVAVAIRDDKFDKKIAIWGTVKKLCYFFLVVMGFLMDFTITYLASSIAIGLNTKGAIGIVITCYLIGTEFVSCSKGFGKLGVPVPEFLQKLVEIFQQSLQSFFNKLLNAFTESGKGSDNK